MSKTGQVGFHGQQPVVKQGTGNPETLKYGKLWATEEYRKYAPGEQCAQEFLAVAKPKPGAEVIDFGCGTGRGALMLALLGGLKVIMVDFVRNSLDPEITQALETQKHVLQFVKADIEQPLPCVAEYGFCTDVMEHIPPDHVDRVLDNILHASQHVFFQISTIPDSYGDLIGEQLHLTVQPYEWWLAKLRHRDCIVKWSKRDETSCMFYVSAWQDGQMIVDVGGVNELDAKILANVEANCAKGWQQVRQYEENTEEVMLVGGSPSLDGHLDEIVQKRAEGVKLVCLNGVYGWALDHGLVPSAQVIVDAREFNARFTKPVVDQCKYFIASQCHPSVLDGLPHDRTFLWHTGDQNIKETISKYYDEWGPVPGGSTVLLRSLVLFRLLGFKRFHLYGCDSCLIGGGHHAYSQPENDLQPVIPVKVTGGRIFYCNPWMIAQAQEFISTIKAMGDFMEIAVYGDGLLKHILDSGASNYDENTFTLT